MIRGGVWAAVVAVLAAGCGPGSEASKPNPALEIPKSTSDPNVKPNRLPAKPPGG